MKNMIATEQRISTRKHSALRLSSLVFAVLMVLTAGFGASSLMTGRAVDSPPDGVKTYHYSGGQHTDDPVVYTESPPVGGPHNPVWQTCGYYDGVIGNEHAVHSLEHGAVWITYRPTATANDKKLLQDWTKDRPYLLVSEYDDQASLFVFTAWNNQLSLDSLSDKRALEFLGYFIQGPQDPEPGAPCAGGTRTMMEKSGT